jgi:hypothetical protein
MSPDSRADDEIWPDHPAYPYHTRAEIDAKLLEAVQAIERGEGTEMTAEDWNRMRAEYWERMTKQKDATAEESVRPTLIVDGERPDLPDENSR